MPDEVTLDVTTIEENVTVETTAGDVVEIQVVAPTGTAATVSVGTTTTGAAGTNASVTNSGSTSAAVFNFTIPRGATGEAGPNSVTIATTSDGTGQIMLDTLAVGTCNILDEVVFDTLTYTFAEGSAQALKDALSISFADVSDAQTGTAELSIDDLTVNDITATGFFDLGDFTVNAPTGQVIFGSAAIVDFSAGSTISFDSISYTYGTGAAAAHRTALGLTTLATTTPGTNVANFLATPTSDNLASALTDENGTGGGFVRAEGATLTSPALVGPVNLTSQDASTADRVMTRALGDARYGVIASVVLPSTQSVTNSTTLTGVTGGSVTLAEGTWHIRCSLMVDAATTTPGIKADINISGLGVNVTGKTYISGFSSFVTLTTQNPVISVVSNLCSLNEAGVTYRNIEFSGIIVLPTSRTLQMRIAQRTSSADAVSIWQGSHFVATRIA